VRASIPLSTGIFVHAGLAFLLAQLVGVEDWRSVKLDVDGAVKVAVEGYKEVVKARGLDVELGEDAQYVVDEQVALTEALIRVYVLAPEGLAQLMQQYKVLEVEREEHWPSFTSTVVPDHELRVDMQARLDALLQERSSSDLYIASFKTAASPDYRNENAGRHDDQGLSEAIMAEHRLRSWARRGVREEGSPVAEWFKPYCKAVEDGQDPPMPRIMGIQMVYLVKGRREQQEGEGPCVTQSHLIRGWCREDITEMEYAWRYKWSGPDTWPDTGRLKGHTLGKGWKRFNVWEYPGGVKAWIDLLASGTVQPDCGDPFANSVQSPMPYFRQDRDMEDWLQSVQAQEQLVAAIAHDVEAHRTEHKADSKSLRSLLNISFPMHRRSCDYPSACQFIPLCYGDDSCFISPFSTGIYEPREPHHAAEREHISMQQMQKKETT